jgi:hypothetical protein
VGPGAANGGNHVPEDVALGDGAVNVRDDQLVAPAQQIDVATAPGGALTTKMVMSLQVMVHKCHWKLLINKIGTNEK